jgi:Putative esterase
MTTQPKPPPMPLFRSPTQPTRRTLLLTLPALLWGCGGGGGGDDAPPLQGTLDARILRANVIGVDYGLRVYLPPASAGPRENLPIVYALDGESWFDTLVRSVEASRGWALVVGINSVSRRNIDFVPPNSCTGGGGGQAAYLDFLRGELAPYVESQFGGDPRQRVLFGHSHGGSFVLYAMLAETPGRHGFRGYIASDSSLGCMFDTAMAWQDSYAAAQRALPVRLHLSHASAGNVLSNVPYADALAARRFEGFEFRPQAYGGSHSGIVPQAINDGLAFVRGAG